jgi:hypothetical protein
MASEAEHVTARNAGPERSRLASALIPIIMGFGLLVVVVGTVAIALLFDRVNDVKSENRLLAAAFERGILQLQQSALQQRTISYWLAYPGHRTLVLSTPTEGGVARGLLKPAEEGQSAILLVAGLGGNCYRPQPTTYG